MAKNNKLASMCLVTFPLLCPKYQREQKKPHFILVLIHYRGESAQ